MQYRALRALYTSTDPNGPDAAEGVVTAEPPAAGFQLCGEGGVLGEATAQNFDLVERGLVEPLDAAAAARENDEKNKATYGTATGTVATLTPVTPEIQPQRTQRIAEKGK